MGQQQVGRGQRAVLALVMGLLLALGLTVAGSGAMALGGRSSTIASPAPPTTVTMHLGTTKGNLRFEPD
jgi:hypothetical protein